MSDSSDDLNRVAARMTICGFLAQALNYPDEELVRSITGGETMGSLGEAFDIVAPRREGSAIDLLEKEYMETVTDPGALLFELEKDYTRLFFASKPRLAYLFESVYNEGKLMQESTFEIARLYHEAGLKVTESFRLPPDHIAVEFEFMAFLVFKELEAVKSGNGDLAGYARQLQARMLESHLRPFGLSFAERVEKHGRTTFYRTVARLVRDLLIDEKSLL